LNAKTSTKAKPLKSKRKNKVSHKKPFVIDFHGHIVNPKVFELTQKNSLHSRIGLGKQTSLGGNKHSEITMRSMLDMEFRLKDMDRMGIDLQVISPSLIHHNTEPMAPSRAIKIVQRVNDSVAEAVADHPDRLAGMGIVPLQDAKQSAKELERMVKKLDLRGVQISTVVRDEEIGSKKFHPFWRKAQQLDIPVFIHPAGNSDPRLKKFGMAFMVGQPYEEALAMSSLVYEGILDKFPGLKILVAHGGGYLPYYAGRQDNAQRAGRDGGTLKGDFSSYIRKFYYETVIFNPDMLDFLSTKVSTKNIVMGTDYPFGEKNPISFVRMTKKISAAQQDAILGKNAARLLKLKI
jgi:aminocarboxymuconate-semialdehyde decarboxylase